ncbi:hypothetical protein BASA83_013687 [Batrachochytrium salamandrivorans]|nr:hypothetical protein BASA83_013687 [Batrachochytrium salamandrivorans]
MLIVIGNDILDVVDFMDKHPGGRGFLKSSIGKDVTVSFNGGVYDHIMQRFSPHTRFEPPISVAHQEIPRQAQDTVEENPTASRTTTTDTHTAAISSTPTPTQISYIGSDDILTVLLGGAFLALTLPGILKHVLVSNG